MNPPPIAIVKVGLNSLEFCDGREVDKKIVGNLVEIFEKSRYGCDREHDSHVIKGHIDPNDLNRILALSNLTLEDLQRSLVSHSYRPRIETGNLKIRCLDGQHRVEAAKSFLLPSDLWWTVKLYFTLKEGERHEARYSDGEIYIKVRHYQRAEQEDLVQEWMLRLRSKSKQRNLSWLLEHADYTYQLDMLEIFPGMWVGFELGNIRRQLALHCDEELLRYLFHIYTQWIVITLDDLEIQRSTNIETVQRLEGKAPSASIADRQSIIEDMNSGILFPNVTDTTTRRRVLEAILGLDVIIPTLKTFNENSKLLEIGVQIIRRELRDYRKGSLFNSLNEIWSPPFNCLVETAEGIFHPILLPHDVDHAYLVYFQTFLAAFRQFPNLGDKPPLRDKRSVPLPARFDPAYQTLFGRRAKLLGYNSSQIQETCSLIDGELSLTRYRPIRKGKEITRCGLPIGQAYAQLQENLFILNLSQARIENSRKPSAIFVQQDFLRAFFRPNVIFADWVGSLHLPRVIAADLTTNTYQHQDGSIHQQSQSATAFLIDSAQERHNFDVPRESIISPTTISISSWGSRLPRSPSVTGTVRSSPRVHDLASRFMNTGIETDVREQMGQDSQVLDTGPENSNIDLALSMISPQSIHEENSEHVWERESNSTTILGSDGDTWISESSTIIASERNEDEDLASTIENQPHRSYLGSHQMRPPPVLASFRQRSFLGARTNAEVGEQRLVRRRGRNGYRSFLIPVSRTTKHGNSQRRSLRGRRRMMRSLLDPHRNYPNNARSLKGKGILRDTNQNTSSQTEDGTVATWPVRSYLRLDQDGQGNSQSTGSTLVSQMQNLQGEASTSFQQHTSTESPAAHNGGTAWAVRSYLRADQDQENYQSPQPSLIPPPVHRAVRSYLRLDQEQRRHSSCAPSSIGTDVTRFALPETEESPTIEFFEYNGMKIFSRSTTNLTGYLKLRKGWTGMVVMDGELRSLRLEHIAKYIQNRGSEGISQTFILVKQPHAERFRLNYPK
jgi:hypothetical protein